MGQMGYQEQMDCQVQTAQMVCRAQTVRLAHREFKV